MVDPLASVWLAYEDDLVLDIPPPPFHFTFERETLITGIKKLAEDREWARAAVNTIRRDVACFIRTYVAQSAPGNASYEDGLDSPH